MGLGVAQLAVPDRINKLIGVEDTPKARMLQRVIGLQELSAGQGVFGMSPPTPILWGRVAGDVAHLGLLAMARGDGRRTDKAKVRNTMAAVAGIGVIDAILAARYQQRWPKEPTGVDALPSSRDDGQMLDAHVEGRPSITILASEGEIRPRLQEFGIAPDGGVTFRSAPGGRGTEVIVATSRRKEKVKAALRRVKQVIETGEVMRSDAAPEGGTIRRQLRQRPAQPLEHEQVQKVVNG